MTDISRVIVPPSGMKEIIAKTATFVVNSGPTIEARIASERSEDPKFGFLKQDHPYHAYYKLKCSKIRNGAPEDDEYVPPALEAARRDNLLKKLRNSKGLSDLGEGPDGSPLLMLAGEDETNMEPLRALEFDLPPPPVSSTKRQIAIAEVSAMWVARNGSAFESALRSREGANPDYSFLRPEDSGHEYFQALVHSYEKLLTQGQEISDWISPVIADRKEMYRRGFQRYKHLLREKQRSLNSEVGTTEAHGRTESTYSWRKFVVVEDWVDRFSLEDFLDDSVPDAVDSEPELQKFTGELRKIDLSEQGQAAAGDDTTVDLTAGSSKAMNAVHEPLLEPNIINGEDRPRMVGNIHVRTDYKRKKRMAVSSDRVTTSRVSGDSLGSPSTGEGMLKCPITGQMVPADKFNEHLRVVLLDPKWKVQKEVVVARARLDSALVSDSGMADNLEDYFLKKQKLDSNQ